MKAEKDREIPCSSDIIIALGVNSYVQSFNERKSNSKNGIGYARVSTKKQKTSISGQILQIQNCCKANKVNLMYICVDIAISGTQPREKRPGLNHLYNSAKTGDIVMVVDISRLSRDLEYALQLCHDFKERGVQLDSFEATDFTNDETIKRVMVVHEMQVSQISQKTSKAMRAKSDAGKLPTKPSYGWRYNGTGVERKVVEEEQKGLEFIRDLVRTQPELNISEITRVLNDPVNKIAPYRRKPKPGQPGWYYTAVKRVLIREGLRSGERFIRLSFEEKAERAERAKTKDGENAALLNEIKDILKADPSKTCNAIATELKLRGIKLKSERRVDHKLVQRILEGIGVQMSAHDPDAEAEAAEIIRKMRTADPKIKVAEIIRRLVLIEIPPLGRAKEWNHYTINKLFKKYDIP